MQDIYEITGSAGGPDHALSGWESMTLRVSGTVYDSIVDGPGMRYTIFVQGCPHDCPGCHNPQTHSFYGGQVRTLGEIADEIGDDPLLSGVTFSGGEPFCQAAALAVLARKIREKGYDLVVYSGYTYERLLEMAGEDAGVRSLLAQTDLLVDGPFLMDQRDLDLLYRGSTNQRLINLAAMRLKGDLQEVILWEQEMPEPR